MESSQKLKKSYDHIIIGYNFSSLMFARELSLHGESFCVLDSHHIGSSFSKFIPSLEKEVFTRPPINSLIDQSLLPSLSELWGEGQVLSNPPQVFEKSQFKSFLGFGNHKVDSMDVVSYYCQPHYAVFTTTAEEATKQAESQIQENLFLDQEITDISYHTGRVENITLNGKTILTGQHFHFFDRLPFLFEKVGPATKKLASQMAKLKWFSSVNLIIHHIKPPSFYEVEQLYLLKGAKEQACLGSFSLFEGELISRWESFIPAEFTIDPETTGNTLREIKRQVRRAFDPDNTHSTDPEHIVIQNHVYSDMARAELKNGKVNGFNNLYTFTPLLGAEFGWVHEGLLGHFAARSFTGSQKKDDESLIDVAAPSSPC